MKTMPTLIAVSLLVASVSTSAYEVDVTSPASLNNSALNYSPDGFEVKTLQIHVENDSFVMPDARVDVDMGYQRHESDQ